MAPKTYRIVAKFWPLICGLIIGGLLGGIMNSFSFFLLFGAIGWAYFHFYRFYELPGIPCEESKGEARSDDTLKKAMDRQHEEESLYSDGIHQHGHTTTPEESLASAGIEPYASMYGYAHFD